MQTRMHVHNGITYLPQHEPPLFHELSRPVNLPYSCHTTLHQFRKVLHTHHHSLLGAVSGAYKPRHRHGQVPATAANVQHTVAWLELVGEKLETVRVHVGGADGGTVAYGL